MTVKVASAPRLFERPHARRLLPLAMRLLPLMLPAAWLVTRRGWRLRRALVRSRTALHTAQEGFDTLLNQAPVGICQTDLAGRYLLANARYCALVGRQPAMLQTMCMADLTHPEDQARHKAGHARMLATGEPFVIEKRYVRPDEADVWVISHMSVTHDADGRPLHVIAAVQDISHRRAAEAALHALNVTLEQRVADALAERARAEDELRQSQRMEALGQLAGGVAHDFNNVLQAIAGGARLIQRRPDDPDTVRRLAGLVVDAADRGASVTRRLLSFARRGALKPGPVEAGPLLEDMREMLARTLGGGICIKASAAPGLPPLMADQGQLETVLVNLATNARDAMMGDDGLPGPGTNTILLSAALDDGSAAALPPGRYVRLDVTDTGPGMGPETLAHAAEPFFTTKPRGRGTGLGLAVARGFAEQSGGAMVLHSAPGQGTAAQLWFPAAPAAAAPRGAGKPRITLVDDDGEIREVLADTLASRGCAVSAYPGASEALDRIGDDMPDVLVSDLSMPGMDGLTLIRAAQRLRPGLPAVLLTGHAGPELDAAVAQVGGGRVLLVQKPVRGMELAARLQELLPPGVTMVP